MTAPAKPGQSALRRALTENIGLKLLALSASIGLFVIVRGTEGTQEAHVSVSVGVVALLPSPTSEKMLISEIPDEVRVTLRGSRAVLNAIRRDPLRPIQMDLRDASQHFYYIQPEEFELPAGVAIEQIVPASLQLTWVDRSERRLRLEPVLEGTPATGHTVASTSIDPTSVRVRGAAAEIARLDVARTEPVDVSGLAQGRHERRVPLGPLPPNVIYVEGVSALVTVVIDEELGSRTLADLEVAVIGGANVSVRPPNISVVISGPRARVDALSPSSVVPFVEVGGLDPARGAQPLPILLRGVPEGLGATAEPAEVLVVPR